MTDTLLDPLATTRARRDVRLSGVVPLGIGDSLNFGVGEAGHGFLSLGGS